MQQRLALTCNWFGWWNKGQLVAMLVVGFDMVHMTAEEQNTVFQ